MLLAPIPSHHVIAGRTVGVQRVQILIGHDHRVPLAVKSTVFGPDGLCASFEVPVIAERGLDAFLVEVIQEVLDVDPVLAEVDVGLVRGKGVCGVSEL